MTNYGPQYTQIKALIDRLRRLTPDEATQIAATCHEIPAARSNAWYTALYAALNAGDAQYICTSRNTTWNAAWSAALDTNWNAAWNAAWNTVRNAAWNAASDTGDAVRSAALNAEDAQYPWDTTWSSTWNAARYAALALATRHLIGQHGYTSDHYLVLTNPVANVLGTLHPDD